jgi:hypothetical protein
MPKEVLVTVINLSRRSWTAEELHYVEAHYPDASTAKIAEALGRSLTQVYQKAAVLGVKKSPEFDASQESGRLKKGQSRGTAFQFPKGHVPANKGLRRPGWAPGRMRETQFGKGQRSGMAARNWKPIGAIRTDPEGYLRIKIREAEHGTEATGFGNTKVWPLLNRHIWEQHHGPIPPKHIVLFKDGNRQNCAIENFELISMADNARRNSMWNNMPRELAEVIQLRGALNRRLRKLDGKKHD